MVETCIFLTLTITFIIMLLKKIRSIAINPRLINQ